MTTILRSPQELRKDWGVLWTGYQATIRGVRFDEFTPEQMRAFQLSTVVHGFVYGFDGCRCNRPAEDILLTSDLDELANTVLDRLLGEDKPIAPGYVVDVLNDMGRETQEGATR